jgi:hypothetical protein
MIELFTPCAPLALIQLDAVARPASQGQISALEHILRRIDHFGAPGYLAIRELKNVVSNVVPSVRNQ